MTTDPALTDPARQFLGCLMQLPTRQAGHLLTGIYPHDLPPGPTATAFTLAYRVIEAGQPPSPVVLLDAAYEQYDITTPGSGGQQRLTYLGRWLIETYQHAPVADLGHAQWLKAVVLKAAWRRAVIAYATRVLQAAEQCSTTDLHRITHDTTQLSDLWQRYLDVTGQPHPERTELEAVA